MKGKTKIAQMTEEVVLSNEGEILKKNTSKTFSFGKEPDFIKVYLENIIFLAEIPNWVSKVLYELIRSVSYAEKGHFIVVNASYKRLIAEALDMKAQTVTNAINSLSKEDILIKKDRGLYMLNPHYFGRGEWKDIAKIRYEVELTAKGKRIVKAEFEEEQNEDQEPKLKVLNGGQG